MTTAVFDVTKAQSFEHVPIWKRELDDYSSSKKDVLKVLVGNKVFSVYFLVQGSLCSRPLL
jgi:hypothetical protein